MASALTDIAECRIFQQNTQSAEPLLRQALDIRKNHFPPTHPAIVASLTRLGEALWLRKEYDEAHIVLEDAVHRALTATYPLFPWQIAEAQSALGACLRSQGQAAEGTRLLAASRMALANDVHLILRIPVDKRYIQMNLQARGNEGPSHAK